MNTAVKAASLVAVAVGATAAGTALTIDHTTTASAVTVAESPLSNELAATPHEPLPPVTGAVLEFFRKFVNDSQAAAYYPKWVAGNCGCARGGTPANPLAFTDAARWFSFRDALLAGGRPDYPPMTTFYGKALADAGLIALNGAPV